jgi:hypothetical protein
MRVRPLLLLTAILAAQGCSDSGQLLAPSRETAKVNAERASAPAAGDVLASAIAGAMRSPEIRTAIRDEMRASPFTEHKLGLQEFLSTPVGRRLTSEAARASGRSIQSIEGLIASLPAADLYFPAEYHRLTWKGTSDVMVAAMITSVVPKLAYRPNGRSISLDFGKAPQAYPALLLIQYAEPKDRRVSPQKNVPGGTIQDRGDGTIGGLVPVRLSDGRVQMKELADIATMDASGHLVHTDQTCQESCGGGGGGGGGTPTPATYLSRFQTVNVYDGTQWETNEFEWRAVFKNDATGEVRILTTTPRITGIAPNTIITPNLMIADRTPDAFGDYVSVPIYETDVGTDDRYTWVQTGGNVVLRPQYLNFKFSCWRFNYENDYPLSNTVYATFTW